MCTEKYLDYPIRTRELMEASRISNMPLKLVIGNPPCSDTIRDNTDKDFSIINHLMEDFIIEKSLSVLSLIVSEHGGYDKR